MNDPQSEILLNDITFDRLVDGELSPAEYRQVLTALEQHPAAWRKCAEAFLQSQAWQREMKAVRDSAETKPAVAMVETAPPAARRGEWLRMFLVAAASFLLAVFATNQAFRWADRAKPAAEQPLAHAQPVDQHKAPVQTNEPQVTNVATGNQPLGKVQLAVNRTGSEEPQIMDVPVYDTQVATELLSTVRPALPDDLLEELEAQGHRVDRQRRLLPVRLDDGRQMIVPVEGYRIVPVNRPSY